jgi:hypothetical protein
MHRPTGVTVLAIVYLLSGGLSLVASSVAVVGARQLTAEAEHSGDALSALATDFASCGDAVFCTGLLGTCASLFTLGTGAGLWTLQSWGWRIALFRSTVKLATHLVAGARGALTLNHVVGVLANIAVLAYLSRPHVRLALSEAPINAG